MMQRTEFGVDDCMKGAVFVLGGLFLAYCVLNALFGEYWSLMIARFLVILVLGGMIYVGVIGIIRKIKIDRHLSEAKIKKAYAAAQFAVIQDAKGGQLIAYDSKNNKWYQWFKPGSAKVYDRMNEGNGIKPEIESDSESDGPEIAGPLLPVLDGMNRILLVGGMGAGKTELLRHLAWSKAQQDGHVIICDSHASPTTWPNFVQVAGIGRNYDEIIGAVNWVCEELDNRYKARANGEKKNFEPLTLIVDELFVLNQFCDLKQQFKSLLAESRKVNIGLIVAGQSDRAGALGLTGNKDLVAGFEACVYLERLDSGQRVGFIRAGNRRDGKYYRHPGPFGSNFTHYPPNGKSKNGFQGQKKHGCNGGNMGKGGYMAIPMQDTDADGRDAEIIDMYREGNTVSKIRQKIFGSKGGMQLKIIKSVLSKYGIA